MSNLWFYATTALIVVVCLSVVGIPPSAIPLIALGALALACLIALLMLVVYLPRFIGEALRHRKS